VSTPRSVELDKDILLVVVNDLVKLIGDKGVDGLVLRSRNRRALESRSQRSRSELGDKALDGRGIDLGPGNVQNVLLGLGGHVLEDDSRQVVEGNREGLSMFSKFNSVDPDKVNLVLEGLGDRLQTVDERSSGLACGVNEHVEEGKVGFGVDGVVFGRNFIHQGQRVLGDESGQLLLIVSVSLVDDHVVVELFVKNDSVRRKSGGSQTVVGDVTEEVGLSKLVGEVVEGLGGLSFRVVSHKNATEDIDWCKRLASDLWRKCDNLHVLQLLETVVLGSIDVGDGRKGLSASKERLESLASMIYNRPKLTSTCS